MEKYGYYNGKIILEKKIKINFNDLGFLRGYGVFDVMKTVNKKPFLIKKHFEKLENSIRLLNIKQTLTFEQCKKIVLKLLNKNKTKKDVYIKTIVTGGLSTSGINIENKPTILIFVGNLSKVTPNAKKYKEGVKVILSNFQRFLPEAKTLNYINLILNQSKKEQVGANEIIYHYNNTVLEGATSNIFIIKNKTIFTPNKNILLGTMRGFILNLLRRNNFKVKTKKISLKELKDADEIFITGTFKEILPVIKINDKIVGDGHVGKTTKRIMLLLKKELKNF